MTEVEEFLEYWEKRGVKLPNPDHQPECFKYYITLWRYLKSRDL